MPFDQIIDRSNIAHIGLAHCNLVLDIVNISKVPSVFRNQAVHHRDGISMLNQSASQVGPNEAQAPGNENLLIGYILLNLWVFLQSFWRDYPLRFDDRVHLWKPLTLPRRLPGPQC